MYSCRVDALEQNALIFIRALITEILDEALYHLIPVVVPMSDMIISSGQSYFYFFFSIPVFIPTGQRLDGRLKTGLALVLFPQGSFSWPSSHFACPVWPKTVFLLHASNNTSTTWYWSNVVLSSNSRVILQMTLTES